MMEIVSTIRVASTNRINRSTWCNWIQQSVSNYETFMKNFQHHQNRSTRHPLSRVTGNITGGNFVARNFIEKWHLFRCNLVGRVGLDFRQCGSLHKIYFLDVSDDYERKKNFSAKIFGVLSTLHQGEPHPPQI